MRQSLLDLSEKKDIVIGKDTNKENEEDKEPVPGRVIKGEKQNKHEKYFAGIIGANIAASLLCLLNFNKSFSVLGFDDK